MASGQKPGAVKFEHITKRNGKEFKRWVQVGVAWKNTSRDGLETVSVELWFRMLPSSELVIFWNEDGDR